MENVYWFSARKTFVDNKKWLWVPSLHSLSGKNLVWDKGFPTEQEATDYLKVHFERIKLDHF